MTTSDSDSGTDSVPMYVREGPAALLGRQHVVLRCVLDGHRHVVWDERVVRERPKAEGGDQYGDHESPACLTFGGCRPFRAAPS